MKIVSIALNVPGPVAVARLVADGAQAIKIEPPWGDPLDGLCRRVVRRLASRHGRRTNRSENHRRPHPDDVAAARRRRVPGEPATCGVGAPRTGCAIAARALPSLRHVNIVGDTRNPEEPGHDLTYQARAGLLQRARCR